jgi:hypothetical protein
LARANASKCLISGRRSRELFRVLVLEGAGAFMPLKRAAEEVAFRHGHFLGWKMKARG